MIFKKNQIKKTAVKYFTAVFFMKSSKFHLLIGKIFKYPNS